MSHENKCTVTFYSICPGKSNYPYHYHTANEEVFYIISGHVPKRFFGNGTPLLTAYGCALTERETGKSYIYTAVNLSTGKREVISRRENPLTTSGAEVMVERIRRSSVAGAGLQPYLPPAMVR